MMVALPQQPGYPQGQATYAAAQPPWSSGQSMPQQAAQPYYSYNQGSRGAASDRLPPQPDLLRRPTQAAAIQQMPVQQTNVPQIKPIDSASSTAWKPVRIPTPSEMGISMETTIKSNNAKTVLSPASQKSTALANPDRFDLASVTTWLDQLGAKKCLREKLSEGIQIQCSFAQGTASQDRIFSVRGANDEAALRELVQEVKQWKEEAGSSR